MLRYINGSYSSSYINHHRGVSIANDTTLAGKNHTRQYPYLGERKHCIFN